MIDRSASALYAMPYPDSHDRLERHPDYQPAAGLILRLILVTIPILFGAVQPWVWSVYTVAIYAVGAGMVCGSGIARRNAEKTAPAEEAPEKRPGVGNARRKTSVAALPAAGAFFLALTLLACLPLPEGLVSLLSPVRMSWVDQSRALLGGGTGPVALSYAPTRSLAWWAFWLALALLFPALSRQLADRRFLTGTLWLLLAVAVAEACYGLLQALVPNLGVLWVATMESRMGDARGTYINRNHFAGFIEMLLPLLLGFVLSLVYRQGRPSFRRLLQAERLHQHLLLALALALMALALVFSKSRAGITGLLIGLFVFFSLVRDNGRRLPRGLWWISVFFVALTLIYGWHIGYGPVIERFLALEDGVSRLDYWRDSLPMIAAHPFGIGPEASETVFPLYNVSMLSEDREAVYLHNDVLQLLVENGWAGFALLSGAFIAFMVRMLRRIRRMDADRDPRSFLLAVGAFAGLVSLSFHSFFDCNLRIPANAVYFVMLMAMVRVASRDGARGTSVRMCSAALRRFPMAAGLALILSVPAWHGAQYGLARRHLFHRDAVFAACSDPGLRNDADACYACARRAEEKLDWTGAAADYRRAALLDPLHLDAWLGLAEMRVMSGDREGARRIAVFCQKHVEPLVRWKWRQTLLTHELDMTEDFGTNINFLIERGVKGYDALFLLETRCQADPWCALDLLAPANRPDYLNWAMRWHRPAAAAAVWERLEAEGGADRDLAVRYVHFLLQRKETAEARRIRLAGGGREGMTNPGFENEISGQAFDWHAGRHREDHWRIRRVAREGRDGSTGLRVDFAGCANISFAHLRQIVPVIPEAPCRLRFWWKSRGLTTDRLPFVEVAAYDVGGLLVRGRPVTPDSDGWQPVELAFTPPADCHAVVVLLRRLTSRRFDSKIAGHLWLDDFALDCRAEEG